MQAMTLLELLLRGIPEPFLFVCAALVFSLCHIKLKSLLFSSFIYIIIVYFIKLIPVPTGMHTILTLIPLVIILNLINRINIFRSIQATVVTTITAALCEGINILLIRYLFKADISYIFSHPTLKVLYGIPSLVFFACVILVFYFKLPRVKGQEIAA